VTRGKKIKIKKKATWRFCAMLCSQGGKAENLEFERGKSQQKNYRGNAKLAYFTEDKNLLTH
jgi:hypothetical protein